MARRGGLKARDKRCGLEYYKKGIRVKLAMLKLRGFTFPGNSCPDGDDLEGTLGDQFLDAKNNFICDFQLVTRDTSNSSHTSKTNA